MAGSVPLLTALGLAFLSFKGQHFSTLRINMLELEVVPEHGLCSDTVEFILGRYLEGLNLRFFICFESYEIKEGLKGLFRYSLYNVAINYCNPTYVGLIKEDIYLKKANLLQQMLQM